MAEEAKLAWALAHVTDPYLNAVERNHVYVEIGVGETFSAIHFLIRAVVREGLTLRGDLVAAFIAWLDAYVGHEDEPHLRELISQVQTHPCDQPPAIRARRRYVSIVARHQAR